MLQEMSGQSRLPPYLAFPRFLLKIDLPDTAKLAYVLLLDRARLSRKNKIWTNGDGYVYVYYTIKSMSETIGKCEMTVKSAYKDLEKAGLIRRERQGKRSPNRIYVRIPGQKEHCPSDGQDSTSQGQKNCPEVIIRARTIRIRIMIGGIIFDVSNGYDHGNECRWRGT